MTSRTNRGSSRPLSKTKNRGAHRGRLQDAHPSRVKSHEIYPVRVRSHDGYIECPSSMLADLGDLALGKEDRPLRVKFEIGGNWFGKDVALKYGVSGAGGAEVNGILVGKREPSRVLIVAFRQMDSRLACEAGGLSEEWQKAFGGLIARVRWDPKFSGLQPVGWFRAHAKASVNLSRRDIEVFHQFFREPWQVGMVLQPGAASTTGRFFFREPDQPIETAAGVQDFVVQRNSESSRVFVEPAARDAASSGALVSGPQHARERKTRMWPAVVLVAVTLAGIVWWMPRPRGENVPPPKDQPATQDLTQEATKEAATLWKKWQDEALAEQQKTALRTDVIPPLPARTEPDVNQQEPDEAPPATTNGRRQPSSGRSDRAGNLSARSPSDTQTVRQTSPATRKPETVSAPAPQPAAASHTARLELPAPPVTSTAAASPSPAIGLPIARDTTPQPLPQPAARDKAAPPVATPSPAPTVEHAPPARPPSAQTATAPAKAVVPPAAAPGPPVPSSGRLIWTGRLRKNENIVIEGGRPSIGSFSGALPGKPVTISISTGNLTKDGMVVYTSRLSGAGKAAEPPGPQNGWNKTVYEWEPDRAADVEVMEAPGPGNDWKRLVLRARNPRDSIILVEWKSIP